MEDQNTSRRCIHLEKDHPAGRSGITTVRPVRIDGWIRQRHQAAAQRHQAAAQRQRHTGKRHDIRHHIRQRQRHTGKRHDIRHHIRQRQRHTGKRHDIRHHIRQRQRHTDKRQFIIQPIFRIILKIRHRESKWQMDRMVCSRSAGAQIPHRHANRLAKRTGSTAPAMEGKRAGSPRYQRTGHRRARLHHRQDRGREHHRHGGRHSSNGNHHYRRQTERRMVRPPMGKVHPPAIQDQRRILEISPWKSLDRHCTTGHRPRCLERLRTASGNSMMT